MKTVDIVLPAYNEASGIAEFHKSLAAVCDSLRDYSFTFRYVLDPCTDTTFEVLQGLLAAEPRLRILQLARRAGHQASLIAGMDRCSADAVIMMDCDGQHPPAVIPALLEKFEQGFDVVQTLRTDAAETGFLKRGSSRAFYALLNLLSPQAQVDPGAADFRLISRRVLTVFQNDLREQNPFLRGLFRWVGFRQTTLRYQAQDRRHGSSKYSLSRLLAFAFSGIHSFSRVPLTLAIRAGLLIAGLSFLFGLYSVVEYFVSGDLPSGYATTITVVCLSLGIQLVFLGILGSYIGSILDEVKGRPLYLVQEELGGDAPGLPLSGARVGREPCHAPTSSSSTTETP